MTQVPFYFTSAGLTPSVVTQLKSKENLPCRESILVSTPNSVYCTVVVKL